MGIVRSWLRSLGGDSRTTCNGADASATGLARTDPPSLDHRPEDHFVRGVGRGAGRLIHGLAADEDRDVTLPVRKADLSSRPNTTRVRGELNLRLLDDVRCFKVREDGKMAFVERGGFTTGAELGSLWRLARPTPDEAWELYEFDHTAKTGFVFDMDLLDGQGLLLSDAELRRNVVDASGRPWDQSGATPL